MNQAGWPPFSPARYGSEQPGHSCESECNYSVAAKVAVVIFGRECVFYPGLADLFEPLGVICAAAHPIKILRKERMICVW